MDGYGHDAQYMSIEELESILAARETSVASQEN